MVFHAGIRQRDTAEMLVHQDSFLSFFELNGKSRPGIVYRRILYVEVVVRDVLPHSDGRDHGIPGFFFLFLWGIGLRQGHWESDKSLLRGRRGGVAGFQQLVVLRFLSRIKAGIQLLR